MESSYISKRFNIYRLLLTLVLISTWVSNEATAFAAGGQLSISSAERVEDALAKETPLIRKPKLGLALGGGGARGAAEVGVLKVLDDAGIEFDCVTGTSIGAVVGGFYCSGVGLAEIEREFRTCAVMRNYMCSPIVFQIIGGPVLSALSNSKQKKYDGLCSGDSFRKYLVGKIDGKDLAIEDLRTPFGAVALNVLDGKPYVLRKGDIGHALQASCALPALRKPVEIDGMLFADGGVVCNLPVKQCRDIGADFVIAVNIDERFEPKSLKNFEKSGSIAQRLISWELHDRDQAQEGSADIVIHPETTGISLLSRRKRDATRALAEGQTAAEKALPEILERLNAVGIYPVKRVKTDVATETRY
jgi:NTE family protein